MNHPLARSYLYVPGDRPDMLEKAADRGSDALIADLEDAVAADAKDHARAAVASWLPGHAGAQAWVRVNSRPDLLAADLEAILSAGGADGIVLPKATAASVAALVQLLPSGIGVIPLLESAIGVLEMREIAAHEGVVRLGVGEADLVGDLGVSLSESGGELLPIRLQMVLVSAAEQIGPPMGSVFTAFRNLAGLESTSIHLLRLGFGARTAIHPGQVRVINRVFTPRTADVERARRVLHKVEEASLMGRATVVADDGSFIDEAVVRSYRRIVELADAYGSIDD